MANIHRSALVRHSRELMFDLVSDIERYPDFLPWCGGARVLERSEQHQLAAVRIMKGPLNTEFTTRNELQAPARISLSLVSGPFRRLSGAWQFTRLEDTACKVELSLDFEFAGGPVGWLLKPVFHQIADTMVGAFVERANQLSRAS